MTELGITQESRLAALEQRVGALADLLWEHDLPGHYAEYRSRLAALRAPGVGARKRDAENAGGTVLNQLLLDNGGVPGDTHAEAVRRILADLATARRERDEAVGICRRLVAGSGETLEGIIRDARALVAGQGVADDGQSSREARVMTEAYGLVKTALAARDAEIASLRASLAEAQGEVARLRKEAHGWEHEHDSVRSSLTDALARLDAAGRLIERAGAFAYQVVDFINGAPISLSLQQSRALLADLRAWGK